MVIQANNGWTEGLQASLWYDTLGQAIQPGAPLQGQQEADVVIIGAGYSGLWTAWYLRQLDPGLKVVILEAGVAGLGASGRNGGWLIGGFGGDVHYLQQLDGERQSRARKLVTGIVAEAVVELKNMGIECDFQHGGNLQLACRYPEQIHRLRQELAHYQAVGFDEQDVTWLSAQEAQRQLHLPNVQGGLFFRHCARVHPLKLVRGLAKAVMACGVLVFEQSPVCRVSKNRVTTPLGQVRAPVIVSALEAYQRLLGLDNHATLAVQSMLIATQPLNPHQWRSIGLDSSQTFADASRLITYGQRTADGRLVFGARGGYGFGAKVRTEFDFTPRALDALPQGDEFDLRVRLLHAFFPQLTDVQVTHGWGGSLALSRQFRPHAIYDPDSGVGLIGGYGGEGVGASKLLAKTLAELILAPAGELCTMPWAHRGKASDILRRWESEPWPYLSYQCSKWLFEWEDRLLSTSARAWQKRGVTKLADGLEWLMSG
ncbi:NAD(P)/FAD-dependent oxidoreductase [Bowmanella denitrificans]|uniref:NAD(P)/FAD-dependent oxidoreductase n=1 Tax=Bowmanella denitrificans TaxID=366582 RepID=UPI000C9A689D|nr:FAD-dependent oxidoreductase [Bowmanella denitrificans]